MFKIIGLKGRWGGGLPSKCRRGEKTKIGQKEVQSCSYSAGVIIWLQAVGLFTEEQQGLRGAWESTHRHTPRRSCQPQNYPETSSLQVDFLPS